MGKLRNREGDKPYIDSQWPGLQFLLARRKSVQRKEISVSFRWKCVLSTHLQFLQTLQRTRGYSCIRPDSITGTRPRPTDTSGISPSKGRTMQTRVGPLAPSLCLVRSRHWWGMCVWLTAPTKAFNPNCVDCKWTPRDSLPLIPILTPERWRRANSILPKFMAQKVWPLPLWGVFFAVVDNCLHMHGYVCVSYIFTNLVYLLKPLW